MSTICDDLRAAILQAAMQGKLTKQLPEDGDAEELYNHIINDIDSKVLKKIRPIADEEILFELPNNWKWIRTGLICNVISGTSYSSKDIVNEGGIRIYRGGNVVDGSNLVDQENDVFINSKLADEEKRVRKDDIVIVASTGSQKVIGKPSIVTTENEGYIGAFLRILRSSKCILPEFFWVYIRSSIYRDTIRSRAVGTNINNVKTEYITNNIFPLPPLDEQKRIVKKVDELMARVADLEQSADALASLKKAFPDDIKTSLLQAAMQGKLTEQLPEDGSAEDLLEEIKTEKEKLIAEGKIKKQKPLAPITDDEIPFSIPDNWKWVRLDELANSMSAGKDKPKDFQKEKDENHPYPVIANGVTNDGILGYTRKPTAPMNTLTVAGRGTIGFSLFREYEYCPIVRLIVVDLSSKVDPRFVQLVMQAFPEESLGTSIPQLTVPMLRPKLIPLPPLAEQKRIVGRLDLLIKIVESIEDVI